MNRQLIWKEWRDQQTPLLALWLLTPLVLLAMAWYQGGTLIDMQDAPQSLAFMASLACLFSVGLSTYSGEWSRGHGAFLARCPGGLNRAFAIKLLVLITALLVTASIAWLTTTSLRALLRLDQPGHWIEWSPRLAAGLIACMLGIVAIASWGMQPGFALIGGPLVAGLLTWPLWWHSLAESSAHIFSAFYGRGGRDQEFAWEPFSTALRNPSELLWVCAIAGALLSTWFAFSSRKSNHRGLTPWWPMALALLGASPAWASWGIDRYQETHCEPGTERFHIESVFVGANGKFAFLNVVSHFEGAKRVAGVPIKVDLTTGDWEAIGGMESSWTSPFKDGRKRPPSSNFGNVATLTMTSANAKANGVHWNAQSGSTVDQAQPRERVQPEPDFERLGFSNKLDFGSPIGLGFRLYEKFGSGNNMVYDVGREQVFTVDLFNEYRLLVGKGQWIVRRHPKDSDSSPWQFYDPEHETFSEAPGLEPDDKLGAFLTDGRVFGANRLGVFLFDPSTGSRTRVDGRSLDLTGAPPVGPYNAYDFWGPLDPNRPVLIHPYTETGHRVGLVDLETNSVSWINFTGLEEGFVAMSGATKCILSVDGKRLEEHDFKTGKRRVLFPRTEDQE